MSSYASFMSGTSYDRYYDPESEYAQEHSFLGREDTQGDYWVCGMPSEEADALVTKHTNEDGSIDYAELGKDIGLNDDQLEAFTNDEPYRVDYEVDGEIRDTQKDGPNDNGECTGDGKLPGGNSDHECKNVPRENITKAEPVKGVSGGEEGGGGASEKDGSSNDDGGDAKETAESLDLSDDYYNGIC